MGNLSERARLLCAVAMALGVSASLGCSEAKKVGDAVTDAIETDVTGLVQDDQGEPVVGANPRKKPRAAGLDLRAVSGSSTRDAAPPSPLPSPDGSPPTGAPGTCPRIPTSRSQPGSRARSLKPA